MVGGEERSSVIRPSSLPALALSPLFEGGSSEFAAAGTIRHRALGKLFSDDPDALKGVPEDQVDGLMWAVEYIKLHAPTLDYPIAFEQPRAFVTSDFEEIRGTPDAVCGPHIFDLKWRQFDYTAQMACYALMVLQQESFTSVTIHVLYAESQRFERFTIDEPSALAIVEPIIARVKEATVCAISQYCNWCSKKLKCELFNAPALAAVEAREDWKLSSWHPSKLDDPEELAKLARALPLLRKLVESASYHLREAWEKKGIVIPGCKRQERPGKRICTDANGLFNAVGLDAETFLKCASIRWASSKKDPNQLGIENAYAAANGISLAAAKREVKRKSEPFVKQGAPTVSIVPLKSQIEDAADAEE